MRRRDRHYPDRRGLTGVDESTLDDLLDAAQRMQADSEHLAAEALELDACAEDRFADAGAYLVPRREWWRPSAELVAQLAEADRLVAAIAALDQRLARLEGLDDADAGRRHRWLDARTAAARRRRDRAASRLRSALVRIGRAGATAAVQVPDVEPILAEAVELLSRARRLRFSLVSRAGRLNEIEREIERREEAERIMGFDSLHLAACFARYGIPEIECPYELEAGEAAYLTTEAQLARPPSESPYLVRTEGVIPPAAWTGVPHWMGAFLDRRVPLGGGGLDPGIVLLTSLRLAFVGAGGSEAIWLDMVADMDVYQDGIAVLHAGAPRRMILGVPAPRQLAFYLNWAKVRPFERGQLAAGLR